MSTDDAGIINCKLTWEKEILDIDLIPFKKLFQNEPEI